MIRKVGLRDAGYVLEWIRENKHRNDLDEMMFDYPTCEVLTDGNAAIPMHQTLTLESMGFKPGTHPKDMVRSVDALMEAIEGVAFNANIRELYYVSSDPEVDRAAERRGWTRTVCYRKKL